MGWVSELSRRGREETWAQAGIGGGSVSRQADVPAQIFLKEISIHKVVSAMAYSGGV